MNVKALSALFPLALRGRRITLTLLLLSILTSAIGIQPVNAQLLEPWMTVYGPGIDGLNVTVLCIVFNFNIIDYETKTHWDWGDGNEEEIYIRSWGEQHQFSHIYSSYGDYVLKVTLWSYHKFLRYWKSIQSETIHISLKIMVETTDETGERKDVFNIPETVYINGSGYTRSTSVDLHIVEDTVWSSGMDIPDRVSGTETSVFTDEYGDIPAGTVAWKGPLTPGKYDIVIDDGNGKYDEGIDALDDVDIEVTAGFFVIPELPLGTLMGVVTCFLALATLRFKRLNLRH